MIGPGKYDDLCTLVRKRADAKGVILIVIGGDLGNGFSCQFASHGMAKATPGLLRDLANQIEADAMKGVPNG